MNHLCKIIIYLTATCIFCLNSLTVYALPDNAKQATTELKELNNKIVLLEKKLKAAVDKKALLNDEIQKTEKKISRTVKKLHDIRIKLNKQQLAISNLEEKIGNLTKDLKTHQKAMAKYILIQYKMGEYQPLKWMLNQENPNEISQLMTYYKYLIQSQQHTISKIKAVNEKLVMAQEEHKKAMNNHKKLEFAILKNQKRLKGDQTYRLNLISNIQKKITSSQIILAQFQKDKQNLAKLLQRLSRKSFVHANKPFIRMKSKLPLPVKTARKNISKLNQGAMFFSREGSSVDSVYAGKVVFSDWLKGYGLLIIIDHGNGYMSLYAHNQSLFKQQGDIVKQSEQIATVGHSGGIKQNGLYFEIRHRGKAISPLNWLS